MLSTPEYSPVQYIHPQHFIGSVASTDHVGYYPGSSQTSPQPPYYGFVNVIASPPLSEFPAQQVYCQQPVPMVHVSPQIANISLPPSSSQQRYLPFVAERSQKRVFVSSDMTVDQLLNTGCLVSLAMTREGARYLAETYPFWDEEARIKLFTFFINTNTLNRICQNNPKCTGFLRELINHSDTGESTYLLNMLGPNTVHFAESYGGCLMLQKALRIMQDGDRAELILKIRGFEDFLAIHPNGSYFIQTAFELLCPSQFSFIINAITAKSAVFDRVAMDKFGCRVIERAVEVLSKAVEKRSRTGRILLASIALGVLRSCTKYTLHEYGNYVVQQVFATDMLRLYADIIVDRAILRRVLLISQEKYGSHVMEKVLRCCSPSKLRAVMAEIFEDYRQQNRTGKDALDQLLRDKYGNYVMQAMVEVSIEVKEGLREGETWWLDEIISKIAEVQDRIRGFTSGRKLITRLGQVLGNDGQVMLGENTSSSYGRPPSTISVNSRSTSVVSAVSNQ